MALEDFVSGFSRSFQPSIQQGQQAYQFNERQDLRERAQAAKERVQQERIAQLRQQMEQSETLLPEKIESLNAEQAQSRAATKQSQAATRGQEIRNDRLPDQIDASIAQTEQATRTSAAQATSARTRAGYTATQDEIAEFRLGQAQDAKQRQEKARRQVDEMRQTASTQPQQLPEREGDPGGFSIDDVPRAIHNYTTGPALTGLFSFLNPYASYEDSKGLFMGDDRAPISDENRQKGKQAIRAEMGTVGALEQQFTNASPEARSPQVAVNALRRIGRVKGKLKENAYGFDAEERKQMMQRIQRQEQLFSQYTPREDPIQRQAQQAFQGAIEEEEYPSAVKALDVIRRMREPAQAEGTGTSPGDFLP